MSRRQARGPRFFVTYLTQHLTPSGRAFCLVWLIAAMQGSVSLEIPIYHIWSFTTVCLALAWLTSRFAVPNIRLTRRPPPPAIAGMPFAYEVEIENRSRRAAYALSVMEVDIPEGLKCARHDVSPFIDHLAPRAKTTLPLQLHGLKRGHYHLSGLYAASSYPLGLFQGLSFHGQETCVTVYPAYSVPTSFYLPLRPTALCVNREVAPSQSLAEAPPEFAYVREYRHGDNPRHIHWASWARTGAPTTKVYQEESGPSVGLVLDTAVDNPRGLPALESGISAIAGIAAYLLREGIEVDYFATAHLLCHFSTDAPSMRFTHLMSTLADLQASASIDWLSVASRLFEQAPGCQTIALLALDWSREIADFVTRLQNRGIGVRTLVIRQGPTSLPLPATATPSRLLPGNPWPQEPSHLPWSGP